MAIFLRVSFGTVVALATAFLFIVGVSAAAFEEWAVVGSAAILWGVMAALVATGWLLWLAGRWTVRKLRRS